ncbi:family 78 glycoside hydrolase catalytic domain [Planomonospora sp. ID67723]|uniref:family 78 glycoside hydrolase catalytic domain n=1 Tax=Planomonospora sp. ID67723 TaxID=2738134 RepID=UPI0018C3C167|nr:family 78 glycoside hydrolase catalytic domain [Planomonospora sp. ID67723]MBG0830075.1 family 78 glycoside hydrolase catalytic domain [Planomonospora sp. ID67723]
MTAAPSGLRVEHLDHPLGIRSATPRLSWRLPDGAAEQHAYRVVADNGWDTGWVDSDQSVLVPYTGPGLGSSQRVTWHVRVRTDLGESRPSDPAWFETGLLTAEDWRAAWIEPARMPEGAPGTRGAALLRRAFVVDRPVVSARLHATARGLYEAFLNGGRVGDAELTPGFTQYDARLQVQTYDVTAQVRPGRNVIGAILSDGWFRGQIGIPRHADQWGDRTALLAQLHLTHDDGSRTVVGTGPGWRGVLGHVTAADLIAGETVEFPLLPRGWDDTGWDDTGWDDVVVLADGHTGLVDSPAPPVRRIEELVPRSVTRLPGGRHVVDLGQNINGWIRLTRLGPAGTHLTLTHAEWTGPDGDVTTDHLRPAVPFLPHPLPAGQVDHVVSAGAPGDVFEPRHTTHGFRYVGIDGHPEDLGVADVRGVVVHTDMRRTGWFSCSDERVNRLHEAAVWSLRGNACDIPTDCPQRERAGWTGDWQLFVPTAAFLYDVAGLSVKWLRDVAADQWPDGTVANISPNARADGPDGPTAFLNGSAGWGDAVVIVPWELYRAYGDTAVLAELWPTMTRWMDRVEREAATRRHPDRVARRPDPAPHERYLWDSGFHWGEWLVPGEQIHDFPAFTAADKGDVATAYYAHSSRLMARIAELLGEEDEAVRYAELSEHARAAWQAEYLDADGRLTPDTQANHVRALAFDLVPAGLRPSVARRLVELIRGAGTHLATGFLATPYLLPVLADTGHLDVAYELLLTDTEPSWLVMVDRGGTTVWEAWNGVDADGVPHESLNHCSKGAVVSFLHRYTAGIEPLDDAPAYRRFRIRPRPGGGLASAEAAHESPYGRIESSWDIDGDRFTLRVAVPSGTRAEVVLPDGRTHIAGPGRHTFAATPPLPR